MRLPYIVLERVNELEAYIELKVGAVDFENLDEQATEKLFFKLKLLYAEEDYNMSKLAYLQAISQNKELKGSTKKQPKYGAFSPDELFSIMRGLDPKKTTVNKQIDKYMREIGAEHGRHNQIESTS